MKNQKKAYLFALTAVAFWSTMGTAFKLTLNYVGYLQLLLYAALISVCLLFVILLIQHKLYILRQISRKEILLSAGMGFLNPFLYYVVLLKAYSILLAQEAVVLNYVWPIMLVLLSIPILKQKIGWQSILAIIVSFSGTVIITFHGNFSEFTLNNPLGIVLALCSTIIWALFWLLNVKDKREEVSKLFLNFAFGFLYILIFSAFYSDIFIKSWQGLLGACYVGFFEMGITYIIWLMALKLSATTAKVTNLIYLSPFTSLIFIHFIVGEKILISTITGLVLIIAGIVWQQLITTTNTLKE
ncbi:MAG TPA: DMT family transporter [Bacteroidales bacterium]|nr:DMT family transporter [Bacteroidales bacterium]HPT04754.1 DMT family transporter [Bacteroidales bacterium]